MKSYLAATLRQALGAVGVLFLIGSVVSAQSGYREPIQQPVAPAPGSGGRGDDVVVALQGFCPVCIVKGMEWVKGAAPYTTDFDGKRYYFPSQEQQAVFLENPAAFVPALSGDDVIEFARNGKRTPGRVEVGMRYNDRLFLFANEQNRTAFKQNPAAFANADLALGGECAVCRVEMQQRVPGVPEFTAVSGGMRFQFPAEDQMRMFLSNPEKYAPVAATSASGSGARVTPAPAYAPPAAAGSGAR